MPALHPVKKNYRKVHVTVFYWEADELQDMVRSWNERLCCFAHSRKKAFLVRYTVTKCADSRCLIGNE